MQTIPIQIYDTTLRDGAQAEGITLSLSDSLRIAHRLDQLGVAYIEGGWPASNPRDTAFFEQARKESWSTARIVAFGSTHRPRCSAAEDKNLNALLSAETEDVAIFGKSSLFQATEVLGVSPEKNLDIIRQSCAFLTKHGRNVLFDAEHFFDGYLLNPDYAEKVVLAAVEGGAKTVVLCDTNGASLLLEFQAACQRIREILPDNIVLGVHTHNDSDLAVANSILGVRAGCRMVQGTINGFGERCGNANLCSIIANLELKTNFRCLPEGHLQGLKQLSLFVDDVANLRPNSRMPFVGDSAFAHKGGTHASAVAKMPSSFEHVVPEMVGNFRRFLLSDLSGHINLEQKAKELGFDIENMKNIKEALQLVKQRENEGYEYEAADASFAVLLHRLSREWGHYFNLEGFRVIIEKRHQGDKTISEATVKVSVKNVTEITAAEGDGPVNALDLALRKSLERFYPQIKGITLTDYKVRIVNGTNGTAAKTRVLVESSDGKTTWCTVGLDENIIQASWEAVVDSVEYAFYKMKIKPILPDDFVAGKDADEVFTTGSKGKE